MPAAYRSGQTALAAGLPSMGVLPRRFNDARALRLDKLRFRTMLPWLGKFIEVLHGVVVSADAYHPLPPKVRA